MRLSGQHAFVTGGGSGIGAAIVHALAAEGAKVTSVGRRIEKLDEAACGLGGIFTFAADVTLRGEVEQALAQSRVAHGPVTILVNNAGAATSAPFGKVTPRSWQETIAVNLEAVYNCSQAALPGLLAAERGRIVTIASTAGLKGYAYSAPYVAAKHGAIGLTRALAIELARTRVTVNAVCPGFAETAIMTAAVARISGKTGMSSEEARAQLAEFNPQGRLIAPEEVASAVVWLCLPESDSINGQAIAVAGGEVM